MSALSADMLRFLARNISSVEQLEVLLLAEANPTRSWTAAEIARELRTNPASAARRLEDLTILGLLRIAARDELAYAYAPEREELRRAVAELRRCYAERRVAVISAIYEPISAADPIHDFADAFRIRGKGK